MKYNKEKRKWDATPNEEKEKKKPKRVVQKKYGVQMVVIPRPKTPVLPPLEQQPLSEEVIRKQAYADAEYDVHLERNNAGRPVPADERAQWPDKVYREAYAKGLEWYRMTQRDDPKSVKYHADTERKDKDAQLLKADKNEAKERALLVASKLAEGKHEVKPCNLVTVLHVDTGQEDTYYLVRARLITRLHEQVVDDYDPLPHLPESISLIRTCSPMGEKLIGRFVGDVFSVKAPAGSIQYRVIRTEPFVSLCEVKPKETDAVPQNEKQDVYAGRGRNDGTQSETLDGSRYLGAMARENGTFGSFPMHDDYGDESDA